MKQLRLVFTIVFLSIIAAHAQASAIIFSENGYEKQVLEYKPEQRGGVIQEKFDYAKMILSETKKDVEKNRNTFNAINYFNVLFAFFELKKPEKNEKLADEKTRNSV
jgi:hypothetical protein